jgi:hypothetical protein
MMNLAMENNKRNVIFAALFSMILLLTIAACDHRQDPYYPIDTQAPPVPTGVTSTTMDQQILVSWTAVSMDPQDNDLAGYRVYRGLDNHIFDHVGTVGRDSSEFLDTGLDNGTTYYYAVSSFDHNGNESALSSETVFDTPRPEGFDVRIYSYRDSSFADLSGFDFSLQDRLPWNSSNCDMFAEYDNAPSVQAFFLWLGPNGAHIQDMGYTSSFDEITYAPESGWSVFNYVEAIVGHTYVIKTVNNHYAKVRITSLFDNPTFGMVFDWGYQVAQGNRELKVAPRTSTSVNSTNGGVR